MLPPIYSLLTAAPAVAAIVGNRVYGHGEAPQGVLDPYVTWFVVAAPPELVLDGPPPFDKHTVQIDCWHPRGDGVLQLAKAVRDVIETHACVTNLIANSREPETKLYRLGLELDFILNR